MALNLPLNDADSNLYAEIQRRLQLKYTEGVHFDSDGSFTHHRSLDATAITDGVRARADSISKAERIKSTFRYKGSVDTITAGNWAKECGFAIGTKGFIEYANKQLDSGNYNKFKAIYTD